MIKNRSTCFILTIFLFLLWLITVSAYAFRCRGKVISLGDTAARVLAECGEPDGIESWTEEHIKRDFFRPTVPNDTTEEERLREPLFIKEYVAVERWTYNLGPNQFVRYLRFENGILKKITTGDYGY